MISLAAPIEEQTEQGANTGSGCEPAALRISTFVGEDHLVDDP